MKKGFTIVEMMVVLAIIAVLMGIVVTASSQAIKAARSRRAQAICKTVQTGMATYYAQYDRWPGPVGDKIAAHSISSRANNEGYYNSTDNSLVVFTAQEVKATVLELVEESRRGNPMLDISGLFVSRDAGEPGSRAYGLDFWSAVNGTKQSKKKMTVAEMNYGYPDTDTGRFRRLKIVYSIPTDTMTVSTQ